MGGGNYTRIILDNGQCWQQPWHQLGVHPAALPTLLILMPLLIEVNDT